MFSWNEIRNRAIGFSREWRDTTSPYEQLTAPLVVEKKVKKPRIGETTFVNDSTD